MLSVENSKFGPGALGAESFKARYGIRYNYVSGAMYKGIASKALVVAMAKAELLGFLGTGGVNMDKVQADIIFIKAALEPNRLFGVNLICQLEKPEAELALVQMYVRNGVTIVEASAYMQMTAALVYYRLSGLSRSVDGEIACKHRIIAKLSRPEVAKKFLSPAPAHLVKKLLDEKRITPEQAQLSQMVPMCSDICVEADSGGHTDRGIALVILPSIQFLKARLVAEHQYQQPIHIGLAGGIGVPQSAAAAFIMGADFILTGSINQCTVEAGTSDCVKEMLQSIDVQDTDYAPAGDMFEIGAKVQVLKKGVLFAARANKLYALYMQYPSWEDIPQDSKRQIEDKFFKQTFAQIWQQVQQYHMAKGNSATIIKAQRNGKHKMALVFKKYFNLTTQYALQGDINNSVNFQVHTGPALGAFNQWVKDTPMAMWQNRHVAEIADKLMQETADLLVQQFNQLNTIHSHQQGAK